MVLFSVVYASPKKLNRKILWNNMVVVSESHNFPWLVIGDFNEILCAKEKF